jgi:hypothetical protein
MYWRKLGPRLRGGDVRLPRLRGGDSLRPFL